MRPDRLSSGARAEGETSNCLLEALQEWNCHSRFARRLQRFRYLHRCSGCFRLEQLSGGACTHWKAPPFTAHARSGHVITRLENAYLPGFATVAVAASAAAVAYGAASMFIPLARRSASKVSTTVGALNTISRSIISCCFDTQDNVLICNHKAVIIRELRNGRSL